MKTTLRFRGGDLAGSYDLDDPTIPEDVTTFWTATGGQAGESNQGYLLAGEFQIRPNERLAEAIPIGSSLAHAILLGDRPPLTAPLRARMMGGGPMM